MTPKRQRKRGEEVLRRDVEVVSIHTYISLNIDDPNGQDPLIGSEPWLEVPES